MADSDQQRTASAYLDHQPVNFSRKYRRMRRNLVCVDDRDAKEGSGALNVKPLMGKLSALPPA